MVTVLNIQYNDQCYARISALIFGIILFSLFLFYFVERILRYAYNFQTGFAAFAYRRVLLEIINLCLMCICVSLNDIATEQLTIYSIGIIVSSLSLIYIFILEDIYPCLLLDPIKEFANELTFEQYISNLCHICDNSNTNDMFIKLGISNREELDQRLDEITDRIAIRHKNSKRIVKASMPMTMINFIIFWTNMAFYCNYGNSNYTVDISSVMCVILILAVRKDWLAVIRDDFSSQFSQIASTLQKSFKPKLTLKDLIKKFVRLRRFGFVLPEMIENDKKYQYSHVHYESKQYVEDIVEESMNLYTWYENKLERDVKRRMFSDSADATLTANEDIRIPATMTCKIVAAEMVRRACPPKDKLKTLSNLSHVILYVSSKVLTRLARQIAEVPYERIKLETVQRDLVLLITCMVIQSEFDKCEHTSTTVLPELHEGDSTLQKMMSTKNSSKSLIMLKYSKLDFLERIEYLLHNWKESTTLTPHDFYKENYLIHIESESNDDDGRAHQILYLNDVVFQDNTSFIDALVVKKIVVNEFMTNLYPINKNLDNVFDALFEDLLKEDIHLNDLFKPSRSTKNVAYSISHDKSDEHVADTPELSSVSAELVTLQDPVHTNSQYSSNSTDSENMSPSFKEVQAKWRARLIHQNSNVLNPFAAIKSLSQTSKKVEQTIPPIAVLSPSGENTLIPSQKAIDPSLPDAENSRIQPFDISHNDIASEPSRYTKLVENELEQAIQNEHQPFGIITFFKFWGRESFTIKVLRWVNWGKTARSYRAKVTDSCLLLFTIVFGAIKTLFCIGPYRLIVDTYNGKIFTAIYWNRAYLAFMHQLPPTVGATFLHWSKTQTNAILINPFFNSLCAGILSWRFFTCAVHVGAPRYNYNKGVIVLVMLVPMLFLMTPKVPSDFHNWYSVLLPMSAMVLGGFITLATCSDTLDATTYLGLPNRYDLTDLHQSFIIPIVYGIMHAALAVFGLLPITMCRFTMRKVMSIPMFGDILARLLGIHDLYFNHRMLGYLLMTLILIGAILWWLVLHHSCTGNDDTASRACTAFYPQGNYFDIRGAPWFCETPSDTSRFRSLWLNYDECVVHQSGNGEAVLFLREVVVLLLVLIITTSEFKYPTLLNIPQAKDTKPVLDITEGATTLTKACNDFAKLKHKVLLFFNKYFVLFYKAIVEPNEFEIFIYTHVVATYILAIAAFFSRFEVFYGSAVCWGWYFLDKLIVMLFCTHRFRFSREDSELFEGAMKIVLIKRHWIPWKSSAGQICFLQIPKLGSFWLGKQWHSFSLAYSNTYDVKATNDVIEFLIQIQRRGSWTYQTKQLLFDDMFLQTKPVSVFVRGPFGSSFEGYRNNEVLMLIGGGSGVASSISVLRELCAFRGNVKKCWFIFAARNFSSVQWTWNAINEVVSKERSGFIRISIHVSARLTSAQEKFVQNNGALKYIYRPGRPDWKKLFRSFGAQSIGADGPKKVKILACANKAIYADINRALVQVNNSNLNPDFSSENFE